MQTSPRHGPPRPLVLAAVVAFAITALQALIVPLFAAPAANLASRDLPIVVAGPPPAVNAVTGMLQRAEPGAFDITAAPDVATADRALRDRRAYAAVVVQPPGAQPPGAQPSGAQPSAAQPSGVQLRTAPGASPAVATLLTQAAAQLGGGRPVQVVEVVPADPDDPRGGGFAAGFLPLALTGIVAGIALTVLVRTRAARLVGLVTFGVLAGLVGAAVLQFWLGVLPGSYWLNAAAMGLFATATSATLAGLGALLGAPGIGLGALVVFLIGNPLSGVASAPELLPQPWGAVGQYLPVGAGGSLLRSTAFFDAAGAATPALILAAYAVVGLTLVLLGRAVIAEPTRRTSSSATEEVHEPGLGRRETVGP